MKVRFAAFITICLFSLGLSAQPPETNYEGTLIASGFRQSIPLASDGPFPIGFNFTFFGNVYSQFYVSANGLVTFADPDGLFNTETTIPTVTTPNNYIAPFWDNLSIVDGGNIMYKTVGAAPTRKCIIQFKNMGFDPVPTPLGTFTVILYETTNIIQVQYRLIVDPYTAASHGGSATIGLENATGSAGILYAFQNGTAVYSEDAISFTPSGSTYTVNDNALYDGVFLTTNIAVPDPGIVTLINPASDAVIFSDQTFAWGSASGAASYTLVIDTDPTLATASYYNAGLNLSYDITGLSVNTTHYWAVFSTNATATTWCEIRRFSTTIPVPCMPVPLTLWTEQGQDKTIKLQYTGCDPGTAAAIITSLPVQGQLYQYDGGARGLQITSVPSTITDPNRNVIYAATGTYGNGAGNFNFKINDVDGDSPIGTVTINVSPPGIPNVLYIAKNNNVEIQFDRIMANPEGKEDQFVINVNGPPVTISSAALKEGDPYTIILTPGTPLSGTETVTVAYNAGDVSSAQGGWLATFTEQTVSLTAQTINWTQSLARKYNESPLMLTATASSSLGITYTSSNPSVATVGGTTLIFHALGTSEITARQAGNPIYAPAKYIKTLTVSKGDQTITFDALPVKIFGDPDFDLTATASSGLIVTFSSSNTAVATVTGNTVHITGGGTTVITASQEGNAWWNPAGQVDHTLTVNKISQTITFDALPAKTYGDTDFSPGAVTSSGLTVTYSSDNTSVATIINNMIHITGTGTAVITASQAGSDTYYPAEDLTQTLTVSKSNQTITFTNYPDEILVKDTYTLTAIVSSGLPVLFESQNTLIATISGNTLTAVSRGTVQIRAYNAGDDNYEPAETLVSVEVISTHKNIMYLFTPNGDEINDQWELPEMEEWGRCDVRIFNRWGKLVFAQDDYDNLWEGMSDGNPLPEGPYYFVIETENAGVKKGTVNIVR